MNKYQFPVIANYELIMKLLPMFISFQRSGTHFLGFLLKHYLNGCGVATGTNFKFALKNNNPLWFHDHDIHCTLPFFDKVLYLYRNPVAVISSLVYVEKERKNCNNSYDEITVILTNMYKKHLEKYLIEYPNKVSIVKYEKLLLKEEKYNEFKIVCDYFDVCFNKNKINELFKKATKTIVVNEHIDTSHSFYGKFLLSKKYEEYKINFKEKYTDMINNIIFKNDKLNQFFE